MNYAFVGGFFIALIAVMVLLLIRLWAKDKLERWGYELTRETHNHLRETHLKLDSLKYQQERLLSKLERLENTASTQTSTLNDLRSRLSQPKSAA
jgi:hypothetical protein